MNIACISLLLLLDIFKLIFTSIDSIDHISLYWKQCNTWFPYYVRFFFYFFSFLSRQTWNKADEEEIKHITSFEIWKTAKKKMAKTTKKKKMSKSLLCLIFDWSDWWSWWFLNLTSLSNLKRNKAESSDRIKCLFFIFPVLFFFSFILLNSREKRVQGIDFTVRYLFDFMNSEKKQKRKRLSRLFVILGRRKNVKCEQKTNERRIKW